MPWGRAFNRLEAVPQKPYGHLINGLGQSATIAIALEPGRSREGAVEGLPKPLD